MSRARIDSLLASFPKVIPTNTQHTSVETTDVRYVYQPLEDLYIVLITNKASNILQDIETLHLFARVVSDMCRASTDQRDIQRNAFDILEAFDEIVSLGYRESVNLIQVRNILEMESHEEKIQENIARVISCYMCNVQRVRLLINPHRKKKLRRRRSSSDVRSSWKCKGGNSSGVQRQQAQVEEVISAVEFLDMRLSHNGTTPQHPSVPHLPLPQFLKLPPSKRVVCNSEARRPPSRSFWTHWAAKLYCQKICQRPRHPSLLSIRLSKQSSTLKAVSLPSHQKGKFPRA